MSKLQKYLNEDSIENAANVLKAFKKEFGGVVMQNRMKVYPNSVNISIERAAEFSGLLKLSKKFKIEYISASGKYLVVTVNLK